MTRRRLLLAGAAVTLAAAAGAGCSAPGPAPGRSTASRPAAGAGSSTSPVTAPASPPAAASPAPATPVTSPASPAGSTAATGSPAPQPRSTCTSLTVRVIRGSAAPGYEFAALQFVNSGTSRCVLYGYPQVTLRLAGAAIGSPSQPSGPASSQFVLDPGAVAESRLQDFSSCQAPLSDEIAVVAPGSSIGAVRPGQLRACTLRVSALALPQ